MFWAKFGGKIRGADGRRHAYEVHVPYKDASTGAQSAKAPAPAALNAKTQNAWLTKATSALTSYMMAKR